MGQTHKSLKRLRYNLNWWTTSSRKTKKIKSGQSRKRITQSKKEEAPKVVPTPPKMIKRCGNKRRRSKVHLHTTQIKQNGVETKESTIIHVYSSRHRCTILKVKGEESCSIDLKQ
jgi:hypothetical protein